MTPEQFVAHWADTQLKETASYVTHFDDLCDLLGHPPLSIDHIQPQSEGGPTVLACI